MTPHDARKLWASGGRESGGPRMSDTELLELVMKRSLKFQRRIRRRDRLEAIGGGVGLLLLSPVLVRGPWLARGAVLLIALAVAVVVLRLARARRLPAARPNAPVAEALRAESTRVAAQIRLLETVLWWYVLPLTVSPVLLTLSLSGFSRYTLGYALFAAAAGVGIYWLNQATVARQLRPRKEELDRLLARLENG